MLQQMPLTQTFDWHCRPRVQDWPLPTVETQLPPMQKKPVAQVVSSAQLVGQVVFEPSHANGAHGGLPGLPALEGPHKPDANWLQELHAPGQLARSQHTESTQKPVSHWLPDVHAPPCEWNSQVLMLSFPRPNITTRRRARSNAMAWLSRADGPLTPRLSQLVPSNSQVSPRMMGLTVISPPKRTVLPVTLS